MKNYYNTFILLLLLIILIFIFVVTNLNKFDNFKDYYVEGCKKNTYGNNDGKQCEECKSCVGVNDVEGQQCNLTNNLCYRSGCNTSNPGHCEKLKDCSLTGASPYNKYKYRENGRKALDGDIGNEGTCSLIYCPNNKYIDLGTMTQSEKNKLESGNLPLDYIQTQYCREPPSCQSSQFTRSGFTHAQNGDVGTKGSCLNNWELCTSGSEYYDPDEEACMPHSGTQNTTCPAGEYISVQGAPKTSGGPGRKIECSSCHESCDGTIVAYYDYDFENKNWSTTTRQCNNTDKCYREQCTNGGKGDCKHATYYQFTQRDARPLNNTVKATDTSPGTPGNFVNHPRCNGNKYRTKTDWNRHNDYNSNCTSFPSCTGTNMYLSGAVTAPGGPNPDSAFGSPGSCQQCSGGEVINGICTTCNNRTQYLNGGCQNCPTSVANGSVVTNSDTSKTDISHCPVNCNEGYKKTVTLGSPTTCTKCETDKYLKSGVCTNCPNPSTKNAIHDNDPNLAKHNENQCKIKCNTGYELSGTTCNPCGNNDYYTAGNAAGIAGSKSGYCTSCPTVSNGEYNNNTTLNTSKEDCTIICDAGHKFSETGSGNDNVKTCTACPAGSYLATAGIDTECTDCEKGEYQNQTGQTSAKASCSDVGGVSGENRLTNNSCKSYVDEINATSFKTCSGYGNYAITDGYINNGYSNGLRNEGKAVKCFSDLSFF